MSGRRVIHVERPKMFPIKVFSRKSRQFFLLGIQTAKDFRLFRLGCLPFGLVSSKEFALRCCPLHSDFGPSSSCWDLASFASSGLMSGCCPDYWTLVTEIWWKLELIWDLTRSKYHGVGRGLDLPRRFTLSLGINRDTITNLDSIPAASYHLLTR